MKKLELLAPAGSLEICKAVIDAGADAVYLGGNMFGARAYAKNFDQEQLFDALDYAHLFDKKIFLTVNTLLKNHEIEKYLYDYIEPLYLHGLDAAIVQDFGVMTFLHEHFPDLPLHASTQMSITNASGAKWVKSHGVSRVVTAREVSLSEIKDLYEKTHLEIESFVHGALCYCYSGQCLLSSLLGGRSGNRGRCAQPCRLQYDVVDKKGRIYNKNQQFPLSPKDLCTIDLLPQMAQAGVYSYKIEGRMKQMEYAAGVTSIYRKYMDLYLNDPKHYQVDPKDVDALLNLGNRNGFTNGYYLSRNDKSMLSLSSSAHKAGDNKPILKDNKSVIPVTVYATFITGQPAQLTVSDDKFSTTVDGDVVMTAMKQPLNAEDVKSRLSKMGDTVFSAADVFVELSDDAFLPVKFINELRRSALEQLQTIRLDSFKRENILDKSIESFKVSDHVACANHQTFVNPMETTDNSKKSVQTQSLVSVLVRSKAQLSAVLKSDFVNRVYIDHSIIDTADELQSLVNKIKSNGKSVYFAFPYVFRKNSVDIINSNKSLLLSADIDGILVRTHDEAGYAIEEFSEKQIIADHGLYTYSNLALSGFRNSGISAFTAPFELNEKELRGRNNRDSEMIVYGWIPVMYTAQCIYKNFEECHKNNRPKNVLSLKDRYGKQFPVLCDCTNCYNTIFNTQPLYLFGQKDKIEKMGFSGYRLEFLLESERETEEILKQYKDTFIENKKADMTKWENRFTNGHFKRGIE